MAAAQLIALLEAEDLEKAPLDCDCEIAILAASLPPPGAGSAAQPLDCDSASAMPYAWTLAALKRWLHQPLAAVVVVVAAVNCHQRLHLDPVEVA